MTFSPRLRVSALTLAISLPLSMAFAADATWDGGGANDNFTDGFNWLTDTAPASGDNLIFDGILRLNPNQNYGNFTDFNDITFATGAGAFVLGGDALGVRGLILNSSSNTQTFSPAGGDIAFRSLPGPINASVNAASGDITFNGSNAYLDIDSLSLTAAVGRTITFNTNLRNGGGQGVAAMVANGSGTVVFTQNANYNGGTTINAGTVRFVSSQSSSSNSTGSNNYAIGASGTLEFNVLNADVVSLNAHNGDKITGTGTLIKSGTGSLLIGAPDFNQDIVNLSPGALIDVQGGTLRNDYGRENWTNNRASLNVAAGATVDTWDGIGGITVDALTGSGTVQHSNYNTGGNQILNNIVVGQANGSGTFSGLLTDIDGGGGGGTHHLGVVKNGTGTQGLSGTNNYRGPTEVNEGTLLINGDQSAATGAVNVDAGATLGGTGIVGGVTTISGNIAPGSGGTGLLTVNNNTTLTGTASAIIEVNGDADFDSINVVGDLTYAGTLSLTFAYEPLLGTTYDLFDFSGFQSGTFSSILFANNGYDGTFNYATGELTMTAIPEPSTFALAGLGLGFLLLRRRVRNA